MQNDELLNVNAGGKHSYHCPLKNRVLYAQVVVSNRSQGTNVCGQPNCLHVPTDFGVIPRTILPHVLKYVAEKYFKHPITWTLKIQGETLSKYMLLRFEIDGHHCINLYEKQGWISSYGSYGWKGFAISLNSYS